MLRRPRRRPRASTPRLFDALEPRQLLTSAQISVTATPVYVQDPPPPYNTSVSVTGTFTTKSVNGGASLVDYTITLQPASTEIMGATYYDANGNYIQQVSLYQVKLGEYTGQLSSVANNGRIDLTVLPNADTDIKATFEYTGYDTYDNPEDPIGSPKEATVTFAAQPKQQVTPFCSVCSPLSGTSGSGSGDNVPDAMSDAGVAYGTGGISPRSPSLLESDGYGWIPMGLDLGWTNLAGFDGGSQGSPFGNGMSDSDLPYLASDPAGYHAVGNAGNAVLFIGKNSNGTYGGEFFSPDVLTPVDTGDYTISQSDGSSLTFYGFGSGLPVAQQGHLKQYTDPYGNVTTTTYNTAGELTSIQRDDGTTTETYAYTYLAGGPNAGKVSNVALERGPAGGAISTVQ